MLTLDSTSFNSQSENAKYACRADDRCNPKLMITDITIEQEVEDVWQSQASKKSSITCFGIH